MEIYVLRHGTTDWNRTHRLQGWTDRPLDEEGVRLAREVGEAWKDLTFDRCYSSPLKRAWDTARYALGERDLPIIPDDRIKEMHFGEWEGMNGMKRGSTNEEVAQALRFDLQNYRTPPGGESIEELLGRTTEFLKELLSDPENEDRRILVSTHGGAGRALMHAVWGGDDFWHGRIPPNCSVCIIYAEQGWITGWEQDVIFYQEEVKDYYAQ